MSSVGPTGRGPKQSAGGFFIPLGNVATQVLQYTTVGGAGGSFLPGTFALAVWGQGGTSASRFTSTISAVAAGGLLRDMGKTVVSAGRTFRKVQLVVNNSQRNGANFALSTNGVAGVNTYQTGATTSAVQDFLTGYIELGFEGTGPSAPVVPYGR